MNRLELIEKVAMAVADPNLWVDEHSECYAGVLFTCLWEPEQFMRAWVNLAPIMLQASPSDLLDALEHVFSEGIYWNAKSDIEESTKVCYDGALAVALATATPQNLDDAMSRFLLSNHSETLSYFRQVGVKDLFDQSFDAGTRFNRRGDGCVHTDEVLELILQYRLLMRVFVRQATRASDWETCAALIRIDPQQMQFIVEIVAETCGEFGLQLPELNGQLVMKNSQYAILIRQAMIKGNSAMAHYDKSRNQACLPTIIKQLKQSHATSEQITKPLAEFVSRARADGFDLSPVIIDLKYTAEYALDHVGETVPVEDQIAYCHREAAEQTNAVESGLLGSFTPQEIAATADADRYFEFLAGQFGAKAYMQYIKDRSVKTRLAGHGLNI